jgi:hypothetical protein
MSPSSLVRLSDFSSYKYSKKDDKVFLCTGTSFAGYTQNVPLLGDCVGPHVYYPNLFNGFRLNLAFVSAVKVIGLIWFWSVSAQYESQIRRIQFFKIGLSYDRLVQEIKYIFHYSVSFYLKHFSTKCKLKKYKQNNFNTGEETVLFITVSAISIY